MDFLSKRFSDFLPWILKEECDWPRLKGKRAGQYSNDPKDSGGPTKWGIDQRGQKAYAKAFGEDPDVWTAAKIKSLTLDDATAIYWRSYWNGPHDSHGCENKPAKLGECLMNTWVNGGKPTLWLSQCNGSPVEYLKLQEAYYRKIGVGHNAGYLSDWLGRTARLKQYLDL